MSAASLFLTRRHCHGKISETEDAMKVQNVLWDFNGTILDDVQIGIDAVNVLLRRRNKPVLSSLDEVYLFSSKIR